MCTVVPRILGPSKQTLAAELEHNTTRQVPQITTKTSTQNNANADGMPLNLLRAIAAAHRPQATASPTAADGRHPTPYRYSMRELFRERERDNTRKLVAILLSLDMSPATTSVPAAATATK